MTESTPFIQNVASEETTHAAEGSEHTAVEMTEGAKDAAGGLKTTAIGVKNQSTETVKTASGDVKEAVADIKNKIAKGAMRVTRASPKIHFLVILTATSAVIEYLYLGSFYLSGFVIFGFLSFMATSCGLPHDLASLKHDPAAEIEEDTESIIKHGRFLPCRIVEGKIEFMGELPAQPNELDPDYVDRMEQ